jgi:hypothetical protein
MNDFRIELEFVLENSCHMVLKSFFMGEKKNHAIELFRTKKR